MSMMFCRGLDIFYVCVLWKTSRVRFERASAITIGLFVSICIISHVLSCATLVIKAYQHTVVITCRNIMENTGASAGRSLVSLNENEILGRA